MEQYTNGFLVLAAVVIALAHVRPFLMLYKSQRRNEALLDKFWRFADSREKAAFNLALKIHGLPPYQDTERYKCCDYGGEIPPPDPPRCKHCKTKLVGIASRKYASGITDPDAGPATGKEQKP